jgi:hypothetical protein
VIDHSESELQAFCGRLLFGETEIHDEQTLADDQALADEITRRLNAVGVQLVRASDQAPLCVITQSDEGLSDLCLACLALCAISLQERDGRNRPKITVKEIWERVGKRDGYTEAYVRRAGLGPLEVRKLVKVVKPEQRASEAYVTAGPALAALDVALIEARLSALSVAA